MNIGSLTKTIGFFTTAIAAIKQAIDMLPEGSQKSKAETALEQAERQLRIAEAETAQGLGYELCRNHFPPEIMTSKDDKNWKCPTCDNERHTGSPEGWGDVLGRSRWNKS
jgi:hypothetical protein